MHIALRPAVIDKLQTTLLHEMTHAFITHLGLLQWIEEGITQTAEEGIKPARSRLALDSNDASELRKYWHDHGLGSFWWGKGTVPGH